MAVTTAEFLAEQPPALVRPDPPRDRYDRPLIPDPRTGKVRPFTRVTTHAKSVSDMFGIHAWEKRLVAQGLVKRPDLYAAVAAANGDKKTLDQLCKDAKEAAGGSERARLGTALHAFTQFHDAGEPIDVPEPWVKDFDAYVAEMHRANIGVHPEWVERMTVIPDMDAAGTFDRIVTMPDGRLLIADLKTGADLSYSFNEIGVQLALYAHGEGLWNGGDKHTPGSTVVAYDPMPDVDQHEALVMHLPVGEAKCTLHLVDLDAGWEMARTCLTVREWRKRRDTHRPFTDAAPAKLDPERSRTNWIKDRLRHIALNDGAKNFTAELWPEIAPKQPPWTDVHIDAIDRVLSHVETVWSLPFAEPDPGQPPPGADLFRAQT